MSKALVHGRHCPFVPGEGWTDPRILHLPRRLLPALHHSIHRRLLNLPSRRSLHMRQRLRRLQKVCSRILCRIPAARIEVGRFLGRKANA